ncbi:hypothetical protein ACP70R_023967 [Stipagrostis hirtigluma subsp. patula]
MAAMVSVGRGVMGPLLKKLGDLLTEKYKLIKGTKGQILFLKAELESMDAFLKKMSDAEETDEQEKCWAKEVRELSYDIEDSINEFMLRVERKSSSKPHGFTGFMERSMSLLTTLNTRIKIAKEFEGLKGRVLEVSQRRLRYKVDHVISKSNNTTVDLRLLALLHAETAGLVGIDGPRDELMQLMVKDGVPAHQLIVLSIVGLGGLGKTTLAMEVYHKLKVQYQCQASVPVSQRPNMGKILRNILAQVGFVSPGNTNMGTWDEQELIMALQNYLLDKRYIIVIDDIWDVSAWDVIRCALPENRNGSRIITTTRILTVARACCANHSEYVYEMKELSEQDSRRLFLKRVFGSDACPPYLKQLSAEILRKCGGMPLAITTISGLLATQRNKVKQHWEYIQKSLVSNYDVSSGLDGMRHVLNLSYINLPHYLKTCMLYLATFPEDYIFERNDLALQWLAEGFICEAHGTDPEDIAKSYFNELINRSLIQPTYFDDELMYCSVHDMILDLIVRKASEENFVTVRDDIKDMTGQQHKVRRLSLHLDGAVDGGALRHMQLSQARTLAIFGTCSDVPPFALFKHLRVLTIEISEGSLSKVSLDLTGICHLIHLRYLKIVAKRHPLVLILPSKVGGLQQLETCQLEGISPQELPSDIVHMSRLLHLLVDDGIKLPIGIENMKNLRTLCCFDLGADSPNNIKGLRELVNLTNLNINWCLNGGETKSTEEVAAGCREVLRTCVEKLCNLKDLYMGTDSFNVCLDVSSSVPASFCYLQRFCAYRFWFSCVPQWIGQLHNLCCLELSVKEILEADVQMLAQLQSLMILRLCILTVPEDKIVICGSGFDTMTHFNVHCSRISYLTFRAGAMANLETLSLGFRGKDCDRNFAWPAGMENLSGLKKIIVNIWGGGANESALTAAESILSDATDTYPSRPTWNIFHHDESWDESDEVEDKDQ